MNDSIRHVRAADAPWMQRTTRLVQLPNSRGAPDPRRGGQRGGDQGFGAADALGEDAAGTAPNVGECRYFAGTAHMVAT